MTNVLELEPFEFDGHEARERDEPRRARRPPRRYRGLPGAFTPYTLRPTPYSQPVDVATEPHRVLRDFFHSIRRPDQIDHASTDFAYA
jgi:hypothetical protein